MLPDADDMPSAFAELAGDASVADHAGLALVVPEGGVGFRKGVALRAAVPETSGDEDSDFFVGKSEIRLSRQCRVPAPPRELSFPEQAKKPKLGAHIAPRPNTRHQLRTRQWCRFCRHRLVAGRSLKQLYKSSDAFETELFLRIKLCPRHGYNGLHGLLSS